MVARNAHRFLSLAFLAVFLLGCHQRSQYQVQGYIEGRYTYVATPVAGRLKELLVARGEQVMQGQTLFVLEGQPESDLYQAAVQNLNQATKARDATEANLVYAKLTLDRDKILVQKKVMQQSELDNAKAIYDATTADLAKAEAAIAAANATLAQSKWTLDQKVLTSPISAVVFDTYYRIGEYAAQNQAILSLLAPQDIKVIFYVKEAMLGGIKLNDPVAVECDACSKTYTGRVSFISPSAEYTPPVIFSIETSEKLIYRIEAEFKADDAVHLHPGQPVLVGYSPHG